MSNAESTLRDAIEAGIADAGWDISEVDAIERRVLAWLASSELAQIDAAAKAMAVATGWRWDTDDPGRGRLAKQSYWQEMTKVAFATGRAVHSPTSL